MDEREALREFVTENIELEEGKITKYLKGEYHKKAGEKRFAKRVGVSPKKLDKPKMVKALKKHRAKALIPIVGPSLVRRSAAKTYKSM